MFYLLVAIIACVFLYYTFQKYMELKKTYTYMLALHSKQKDEMTQLNEKVNDLQVYKDDVSKTFKLLDNELKLITENTQNALVMNNRMNNLQLTAPVQHQHPLTTLLHTIIPPIPTMNQQQPSNFQTYTPDAGQFMFSYDLPQQAEFSQQNYQYTTSNQMSNQSNTNSVANQVSNTQEEYSRQNYPGENYNNNNNQVVESNTEVKEDEEKVESVDVSSHQQVERERESNEESTPATNETNVKLQSSIDEVRNDEGLSGVSFSNIDLNEEDLSSHLKNSALIFMDNKINPSSEFEKFLI